MAGDSRPGPDAPSPWHFAPERMNALTDGVFAIVLTLLVLELKLPQENESILVLLVDDWRVVVAWLISFVLLARFWLVHHAVTVGLRRCRSATLALNFGVLGAVSLVPFSADLIGTERIAEPWSTVVFAANVGLLSVTVGLLVRHVLLEPDMLHPEGPLQLLGRHRWRHLYALPAVAMASALLAFVEPYLAVGLLATEFVVFAWSSWQGQAAARRYRISSHAPMEGTS